MTNTPQITGNVDFSLIGEEDVDFGEGTTTIDNFGESVVSTRINTFKIISDSSLLSSLDQRKFPNVCLSNVSGLSFYKFVGNSYELINIVPISRSVTATVGIVLQNEDVLLLQSTALVQIRTISESFVGRRITLMSLSAFAIGITKAGNIRGDFSVLSLNLNDAVTLVYNGTFWCKVS